MRPEHVFWFSIITSSSLLSKVATSLAHGQTETNFSLQGGAEISSNITTFGPQLVPSDIVSEVQDIVSFLPKQTTNLDVDFNEERSAESNGVPANSLASKSDAFGEVSESFNGNSEHGVKNSSSGSVESTNNYGTLLLGKDDTKVFFGPSTNEHVSSGNSVDVDTRPILADDVSNYYDEEEYVTGSELEEESAKKEATDNTEIMYNKASLLKSEADSFPLSEPSVREKNTVTYTADSGTPYIPIDDEIKDGYITGTNPTMTINNRMKTPDDTGKAIKSEPDHAAQHRPLEYATTDKVLTNFINTNYSGSSTTATVTNRMKILSSMAIWGEILSAATSEEPRERKRTSKHTLSRGTEPSRSPYQFRNNYADDYYEVWGQNSDRSTTMSVTDSKEIKTTNDKNQRTYVSYLPTGQDGAHTFRAETVYTLDEVTNAAVDHDSTVHEESERATTGARTLPVSMQDAATSEDMQQTVKMEPFRVLKKGGVVNNTATPKHWEEKYSSVTITNKKYSSVTITNNGSLAASEPPTSRYRTSRRTSFSKTNKFNCSTVELEGSVTPQGLAAFKEYKEESTKSIRNFESARGSEFRAQRKSFRKVFTTSKDSVACAHRDTNPTDAKADYEESSVLELPTKQTPASDISTIPENYDVCVDCLEEETDTTLFNNEITTVPEPREQQGKDYSKERDESILEEWEKIPPEIMANENIERKMQNFQPKIVSTAINRTSIREVSFSDYPWFVIIETSNKGVRCAGAMVAPRWLLTASSCLRSDDSRTDAYSVPVEVTVNITGRKYRAEGAVFAPGGGVALARLQEPPESALVMTGRLDLADPIPVTLWTRCVVLGMGRCPDGALKGSTPVSCPEHMYAAGARAVSGSRSQPAGTKQTEPGVVRAPCSGGPGAPLACHRDYSASNWPPPPPALTAEPAENEPAQLVLVGVSAGKNRPGLSCRGSSADYRSIGPLQEWVERAIAYANRQLERINGRPVMVPPDPYAQRLLRLKMEGSLPELNSRGTTTSGRYLISLLTAVASRILYSL